MTRSLTLHLVDVLGGKANESELATAFAEELSKSVPSVDRTLAAELARTSAASLVQGLNDAKRSTVRNLVRRGVRGDWSEAFLAERIEANIGLGDRFSNAVENYRLGLIERGTPLGTARRQANAYAKRLRTHRARTIARTELARLTAEAKRATWAEWKKVGKIDQFAVRVWHTHSQERRCPTCRPMNGQRAAIGKSYSRGHSGPPLHPNCQCWETLERGPDVLAKDESSLDTGFKYRHLVEKIHADD
jgi:SPP1 gp7 family putative phage head morphogenesis protein